MRADDGQTSLTDASLPGYVRQLGLTSATDELHVEAAGDGNINWVRRVRAPRTGRSWIVKQARPALERFPQYQASTERIVFEARYFAIASRLDAQRVCPEVLHFDATQRVLVLEDLGDAERLDCALLRGADANGTARALGVFLGAVHAGTRDAGLAARFRNDNMRRLHGDHIFLLPFRPNDFPLPPELRARAEAVQRDAALRSIADAAYARYLEPHGALVHADVQAGNVLLASAGPKLLDAEIAHVGDPAFDVGMLLAHLLLPAIAQGDLRPAIAAAATLWGAYGRAFADTLPPAFRDAARYAGIEVMRRTIGAARVAAVDRLDTALAAVDLAVRLMRHPPDTPDDLEER